jgi:hypothetical protein
VKVLPQFSLSQKVLILVTLPLLMQFLLMLGLARVQDEAEKQLAEANQSRKIADAINHIGNDIYQLIAMYGEETSGIPFSTADETYIEYRQRLDKNLDEIRTLSSNKPDILQSVDKVTSSVDSAVKDLLAIKSNYKQNGSQYREERKVLWKKLRANITQMLGSDLFVAGKRERKLANRTQEIRVRMRIAQQRLMVTEAVAGILLTLVVAVILTRGITDRLAKLTENTYRLSSGEPLHPVQTALKNRKNTHGSFVIVLSQFAPIMYS